MSAEFAAREEDGRRARPLLTGAVTAAWLVGLAALGALTDDGVVRGLLFVVLAVSALSIAAHGIGDGMVAPRPPSAGWERMARHAWLSGGLGSVLFFARALSAPSSSIGDITARMAAAAWPAVWGLAMAMLAGLLAVRLDRTGRGERRAHAATPAWQRALGYLMFAALVGAAPSHLSPGASASGLEAWGLLAHWPAILLVVGAALLGIVSVGEGPRTRLAAPVCALAGTLGGVAGLAVALAGFARPDIGRVTAGVSFMITACSTGLLLVLTASGLREQHRLAPQGPAASAAQSSWALFPLVVLLFLVIVFLLVVTPMTKPV